MSGRRSRASYAEGVDWIALNDEAGSSEALAAEVVAGYISTMLLADLFGRDRDEVARAIVRRRRELWRLGEL
jgi:hypothetical protein